MSSAWYALRRTIPPWDVDRNLRELIEFCKSSLIDEIIAKVDTEEFTHGLPTVQWLDDYMPVLRRMKAELDAVGVVFSINPWVTLVHSDRGRDVRQVHPDVDQMVGHDGSQCKVTACPLSAGWRNLTRELWRRYASLEPDVLWVEDDIRTFNHAPVEHGCFCPSHLKLFAERIGKAVTREELVETILAPGNPHPWRKEWMDLSGEIMVDVTAFLEKVVHEVSPDTRMGLMCSLPNHHSIEGRNWQAFTSALAGNKPLVVRPSMGNYSEWSLRGLYDAELTVRQTMHCLGPNVISQTEVENIPFSLYSKSARFTFLQMALSFAMGADGVTMNLFDHLGSPMADVPEYGNMLREEKPFLNALAERCHGAKSSGVQLLHADRGSEHVQLSEHAQYGNLSSEGQGWHRPLQALGFSVTFDKSCVATASGQVLRSLSDEQITSLLSRGLLLDISAAQCLIDMGYGAMIGLTIKEILNKEDLPIAAEEYHNPDFGGSERKYLTLTLGGIGGYMPLGSVAPADNAIVVSSVVDMDRNRLLPFVILFENELGGRVAVYPIDIQLCLSPGFLQPYRKQQLETVMCWLSRDKMPMAVSGGAYPLSFRNDAENYSVIGLFNLSLDEWPSVEFNISHNGRELSKVDFLETSGKWAPASKIETSASANQVRITCAQPLAPMTPLALTIWWK